MNGGEVACQGDFRKSKLLLIGALPAVLAIASFESLNSQQTEDPTLRLGKDLEKSITETAGEGRQTFLFNTFGDESFCGDKLHLHQAIAGARFGGIGPGLSPRQGWQLA